jgi:Flp pilus assembly pilin Flp
MATEHGLLSAGIAPAIIAAGNTFQFEDRI